MFGWFKKKKTESIPDTWAMLQSSENGLPILIRMREHAPPKIDTKSYPHLISILWQYDGTESNGMPRSDVNSQMETFENILDSLEERSVAYLVVAITGNNRKEWLWYASDPERYITSINDALSGSPKYPIDIQVSSDPKWETFNAFASNLTKH